VSFWGIADYSKLESSEAASRSGNKVIAARLAFVPKIVGQSLFRVVFGVNPYLDPSATITYQAMIPDDSEVFEIAGFGKVEDLIKLLRNGDASLTDRDEEGRSILNVGHFVIKSHQDLSRIC
jgi:hypothetical protein